MIDIAIAGGGAAGFFAAINIKLRFPHKRVVIFEKGPNILGKVKVSGGGRCNVTHNCYDPVVLSSFYPRGNRELISVFSRFGPKETVEWFANQGVPIKAEKDGRMFPISDDSQTIIDCFVDLYNKLNVDVQTRNGIQSIIRKEDCFEIETERGLQKASKVIFATGSSESVWKMLSALGHHIIQPVPSLFTFNVKHPLIEDLMGLSVPMAGVKLLVSKELTKKYRLKDKDLYQKGPMLITHWGLSGPAILKLSSIAALLLNELNYRFKIAVNFSGMDFQSTLDHLLSLRNSNGKKQVINTPLFDIPSRWWNRIHSLTFKVTEIRWAEISNKDIEQLARNLSEFELNVDGKSTFKEEFVTAGGVDLKEVDFRTMESKIVPGLYFAGEVLNIDALTGGFNFQAAWSEAWVISQSV